MVFTQRISSGLMIFFLLFKLLFDCEVVLLWEIRNLINLESANFKFYPELSPLNDHTLIPCRTIKKFFFHFTQRSDESEENEDPKVNRKEEYKNGKEKEGRENGNVNHHTTKQPSKKRKEDLPESNSEVKKPPLEKKKVYKPFDHHPLLFQN